MTEKIRIKFSANWYEPTAWLDDKAGSMERDIEVYRDFSKLIPNNYLALYGKVSKRLGLWSPGKLVDSQGNEVIFGVPGNSYGYLFIGRALRKIKEGLDIVLWGFYDGKGLEVYDGATPEEFEKLRKLTQETLEVPTP